MLLFKTIDELTDRVWFITGSRMFGVANTKSDIDICVSVYHVDEVRQHFSLPSSGTSGIKDSDYSQGFKFDCVVDDVASTKDSTIQNAYTVNIIPLHPRDFVAWAIATKMHTIQLSDRKKVNEISLTKDQRINNFEVMVSMTKYNLQADVNLGLLRQNLDMFLPLQKASWINPNAVASHSITL